MTNEEDWRLNGQDRYLHGAALVHQKYTVWTETWEHDHCEFCFAKFMDPNFSELHRQFIEENADVLIEGYATSDGDESGARYRWICDACLEDFKDRFEWTVSTEDLLRAWREAAADLGIRVDSHMHMVRVFEFGSRAGMLCAVNGTPNGRESLTEAADALGSGRSELGSTYRTYNRDSFIEVLNDWGWTGDGTPPGWYAGAAASK